MKKIKASTLTEVIVALIIITLVSAFFFAIIIKAGNYHKNRHKIIIQQQLFEIINEAKQHGYLEDETLEMNGYYFVKTVESYKNIWGVWEITVDAFNYNNNKIASHKAIIKEPVNNLE